MVEKAGKIAGEQSDTMLSDWLNDLSHSARREAAGIAVIGNEICLSKGELEHGVCVLARQLREIGIVPGDRVAVCLERVPFSVVAFLAVLRVGGTYIPIDMQYPSARVTAMLRCSPSALITSQSLKQDLSAIDCPVILALDEKAGSDNDEPGDADQVADEYPAYMMFTSGSTGASAGVIVSRGALARYAAALREALSLSDSDVYLHTASFSFSASIRQIIAPLATGAGMVIADEEARHDPFRLLELMKRRGVTVWDTVPSLWRMVERVLSRTGSHAENEFLSETLRLILLTGEPLPWALVCAWKGHLGSAVKIINLYSQTETAGTVSMFPIPEGVLPQTGNVPLGRPLRGVALMVLDEDLNPAAPGHQGEVYVASERLAEGYQGRAEITASRFLSGFDTGGENRRIFRTGDFVQIEADGSLVPIGRRDHRVKIRGFRVDLLAIETALTDDPEIGQAVVLVEDLTRLIAYVVPKKGESPLAAEIQNRLRQKLPDHAVPGQVIVTDRIPVTANGKVDRDALMRLRDSKPAARVKASAMTDETLAALLPIWEQTLAYKGAGAGDDFFEKGGDSLSAVSLFLEIEDHFGIRLPPSTLMTAGTVAALAAQIRGAPRSAPARAVLELRKDGNLPPLFLVHAIWEHIPHFRELVKLLDPNLPVYALEPLRNTEVTSRELDVGQLVKQYAREIRNTHPEGPFFLAGWSIGGLMAFSVAVELESGGDNPAALILIDALSPSLRPKVRPENPRFLCQIGNYLQTAVKRQIQSFKLSPWQQSERLFWMIRGAVKRLHSLARKPAVHRVRARLQEEVSRFVDRYQPPPYRGSAVLFRSEQPAVDPEQEHDLGWSKHIFGKLEIEHLPGDHVTIVIEPRNMRLLAARISEVVNRESRVEKKRYRQGTTDAQAMMDLFLRESKKLTGREYNERIPWINTITTDSIRHFAWGICDDNPHWTGESHGQQGPKGRLPAPPCILIAARYPVLHGAPLDVPLISLLRDIEFSWEQRIHDGDEIQSSTVQGEVHDARDPSGSRKIYVDGYTTYLDTHGEVIGRARSTVVRMLNQGSYRIDNWSVYRYSPEELERIANDINSEVRTGSRLLSEGEFAVGTRLPQIVRGPMTLGDLVCWHSAVGPSYRPGPLGYKDTSKTPQFRVWNPITGWPVKYMLQHEDVNLAHQRGMPAPFDNGVMRFAWVAPLITNWMGDEGFLSRLHVRIALPVFYGDTCWYSGEVTQRSRELDSWRVSVRLTGTNQHGSITTTGSAEVLLPNRNI